MKKRMIAIALTLLIALAAPVALAAGNVNIAVQGRDGFDDYISSLFVWDGRLLKSSYNGLYTWSEEGGLAQVEDFERMDRMIAPQENEDGERVVVIGEEELELEEDEYVYFTENIYTAGDRLFKYMILSSSDGGVQGTMFVELFIEEDGTFSFGGIIDFDDALVENYGDWSSYSTLEAPCYTDGVIYSLVWTENGRQLVAVDVDEAEADFLTLDTDNDVSSLAAFGEGKLLAVTQDYNADPVECYLYLYDVEEEELKNLGSLPRIGYDSPRALCYDEARGKLYYVLAGGVWRMDVSEDGLGEPEQFADMPLEVYSDASAVLLGNLYILSSYNGVVGRDVTIEQIPEAKLTIANINYDEAIRKAYFDFTEKYPEFMVSIANGSTSTDDILQATLTRSSDVDIYVMGADDPAYGALLSRGYMAELGGSETLASLVGSMYPQLRELASKDGELYAVPLDMYAITRTINTALLTEKLGFTEEELPTTYAEMFGLMAKLADGRLEDVPEVTLLGPGYIARDARYNAFSDMFESYLLWLDADEGNLARGRQVLLDLCKAFEEIDWSGFGMPEEYEDEGEWEWEWNSENIVLSNSSLGVYTWFLTETETQAIALLSIAEGEDVMLEGNITLAFVNPFSEHREAAIEYLEMATALMDQSTLAMMVPTMNDGIENPYYEENMKYYDERIAEYEESLAKAEEDEDDEAVARFTELLENFTGYREEYVETGRYNASPESIALYRQYAELIVPARTSMWQITDSEGNGLYSHINKYLDGTFTAEQLADKLESMITMQRMEDM